MASTWQKCMSSVSPVSSPAAESDAATQTELPREHAAIQILGCRARPRFLSVSDSSGEYTCGRCTQVEGLLSLVAELQEEVGGLRTVRETEKKMDW